MRHQGCARVAGGSRVVSVGETLRRAPEIPPRAALGPRRSGWCADPFCLLLAWIRGGGALGACPVLGGRVGHFRGQQTCPLFLSLPLQVADLAPAGDGRTGG